MKKKNDSGQALVEIAISLSIFLLLAMGTIDFAFLFNHKLTLQNAVRQAGRYAITGPMPTRLQRTCSLTRYQLDHQYPGECVGGSSQFQQCGYRCHDNLHQ